VVGGCYGVEGKIIFNQNYKALARTDAGPTAGPNYVGIGPGGVAAIRVISGSKIPRRC